MPGDVIPLRENRTYQIVLTQTVEVMSTTALSDDALRVCGEQIAAGSRPWNVIPEGVVTSWPVGSPAVLVVGRDDADLRKIVERTSRMGLCSQTHHEHLMRAAQAALNPVQADPEEAEIDAP